MLPLKNCGYFIEQSIKINQMSKFVLSGTHNNSSTLIQKEKEKEKTLKNATHTILKDNFFLLLGDYKKYTYSWMLLFSDCWNIEFRFFMVP